MLTGIVFRINQCSSRVTSPKHIMYLLGSTAEPEFLGTLKLSDGSFEAGFCCVGKVLMFGGHLQERVQFRKCRGVSVACSPL